MANPLEVLSGGIRETGLNLLSGAANVASAVLGSDLAQQLFDNYVPLERWTEYQRAYNWEIVFPYKIDRIPGPIVSKYCKAVAFGDYSFSEIFEIQKGPKSMFSPGTMSIQNVTALFLAPVPNLVLGYFQEWKKFIVSREGFYFPQRMYKRPIYVRLYTTQGITSATIKLVDAFPKSFYNYNLKYEGQDLVMYEVVFCIDDIEVTGIDLGSSIPRVLKHVIKF